MTAQPRFISEDTPVSPIGYTGAQDIFGDGHHPLNPVLYNNGLIEYERGVASVAITPHGELILLSTTDRDDMRFQHRFNKDGKDTYIPEEDLTVPFENRVVGQDILNDGSEYMGQFIRDDELPDGENNYNHMLGVSAWEPTPEHLVNDKLNDFAKYHRKDLLKSGILMQHSALCWTSREMVFAAKPKMRWKLFGKPEPITNEDGEPLYTLKTLIAPGKGLDTGKLYHENFGKHAKLGASHLVRTFGRATHKMVSERRWMSRDEMGEVIGAIPHPRRPFMRLMANMIAETQDDLTMAQMREIIESRFSPVAKLLRQEKSLYTHDLTENGSVRKQGAEWVKGRIKQTFAKAVYGLADIKVIDLVTGVVVPPAVTALLLMKDHEEISTGIAAGMAAGAALRFGWLWWTRSRPDLKTESKDDLIHHWWPEGTKKLNVPNQYEKVDAGFFPNLRILQRSELPSLAHIPSEAPKTMPAWDIFYLLDMQNGPYGSVASIHQIGNQRVALVREDRNNSGMMIEYWPGLRTAFAKNPASPHLPQTLRNQFAEHPEPIRMVSVEYDKLNNITGYTSRFISEEDYKALTEKFAAVPARNIYRQKDPTGHLLIPPYHLKEIKVRRHRETGENIWVDESKAAVGAEVAAKIFEGVFKAGPH